MADLREALPHVDPISDDEVAVIQAAVSENQHSILMGVSAPWAWAIVHAIREQGWELRRCALSKSEEQERGGLWHRNTATSAERALLDTEEQDKGHDGPIHEEHVP